MDTKTIKYKMVSNPLVRILVGLLVCLGIVIIGQEIAGKSLTLLGLSRDYRNLIKGLIVSILAVSSYRTFFRFIEKRTISELSTNGLAKNLLLGISIGVVLQCLTILVIYINNGFKVISINPVSFIIIPLAVSFTVAILEEILIRGILFRIVEEKLGSYLALLISALIFGALHLANPGSSLVSASCITIEAGFLLGAAYMYSRNLWLPIAIHFAWNFMQSGVFGTITSGNEKTNSLLTTQITGSELITGGAFGPEGTLQATVFGLITTIVLMYLNIKRNRILKPFWKK